MGDSWTWYRIVTKQLIFTSSHQECPYPGCSGLEDQHHLFWDCAQMGKLSLEVDWNWNDFGAQVGRLATLDIKQRGTTNAITSLWTPPHDMWGSYDRPYKSLQAPVEVGHRDHTCGYLASPEHRQARRSIWIKLSYENIKPCDDPIWAIARYCRATNRYRFQGIAGLQILRAMATDVPLDEGA